MSNIDEEETWNAIFYPDNLLCDYHYKIKWLKSSHYHITLDRESNHGDEETMKDFADDISHEREIASVYPVI